MGRASIFPSAAVALVLAGCAAQTDGPDTTPIGAAAAPAASATVASVPAAAGGYKLSDAEKKLDCSKLTGQMKVRIANMRAAFGERRGTDASRVIQSAVVPVYGGSIRGANPNADLQLDRAKLEAFNARLAEKKCKTVEIDAELRGESPAAAPAPAGPAKAAG